MPAALIEAPALVLITTVGRMVIRAWFVGLSPQQQRGWLTAWESGVISYELIATLPAGRRPYDADPWVLVTKVGWPASGSPALDSQMVRALEDFLEAEFGRSTAAKPDSEPPPAPMGRS